MWKTRYRTPSRPCNLPGLNEDCSVSTNLARSLETSPGVTAPLSSSLSSSSVVFVHHLHKIGPARHYKVWKKWNKKTTHYCSKLKKVSFKPSFETYDGTGIVNRLRATVPNDWSGNRKAPSPSLSLILETLNAKMMISVSVTEVRCAR